MQTKNLFYQTFIEDVLYSNSPWLKNPLSLPKVENFYREVFFRIEKQVFAPHQMAVVIKGPRRVGKTEIQKQLIVKLINEKNVDPKRVLYVSLDDVQIQAEKPEKRFEIVCNILNAWANQIGFETYDEIQGVAYCFLDEVQAVENWAYLVKNRVERNSNVKMILSGSAAHSIFQKSLEILLGRVISEEITTFSFREILLKKEIITPLEIQALQKIQQNFEISLSAKKLFAELRIFAESKQEQLQENLKKFLAEGGFPQLWKIETENIIEKAHLIDENYVKKTTLEDLMLLRDIKKPELFERLLRHLFARPGQEYNQNKVASELGTTAVTLADAIRLIKQTDLLIFTEKFSAKAEMLQRQNLKIYPIDLQLTFAMTKIVPTLDSEEKGYIAESLVAQTLARLKGISNLGFLRQTNSGTTNEIDFYVKSDIQETALEVKYQNQINGQDLQFLTKTVTENNLDGGLLIVPNKWHESGNIFSIPLWAFCLLA